MLFLPSYLAVDITWTSRAVYYPGLLSAGYFSTAIFRISNIWVSCSLKDSGDYYIQNENSSQKV